MRQIQIHFCCTIAHFLYTLRSLPVYMQLLTHV